MFRFKKKTLIYATISIVLLLTLASFISYLKLPAIDALKYPLNLFALLGREIKGIIFYHHNFIQNERLKKEVDLLKYRLNEMNEVYLENKRLRNLLSFKQKATYKVIACRVIGRSPDNWSSIVIIDKGRDSGIRQGSVAISYAGLAGRVIEVAASTSKVILVNDPNLSVSGMVQRSRQEGLLTGTLGNNLIMKYLPKEADIKTGDLIITAGLTDVYPKGLLIGEVIDIGDDFSGLSRYAIVKPAVNLSSLEELLIIIR